MPFVNGCLQVHVCLCLGPYPYPCPFSGQLILGLESLNCLFTLVSKQSLKLPQDSCLPVRFEFYLTHTHRVSIPSIPSTGLCVMESYYSITFKLSILPWKYVFTPRRRRLLIIFTTVWLALVLVLQHTLPPTSVWPHRDQPVNEAPHQPWIASAL